MPTQRLNKDGSIDRRRFNGGRPVGSGGTYTKPKRTTAHRGRGVASLNAVIRPYDQSEACRHTLVVDWTCPKCGHRNNGHLWYGRDQYFCRQCDESTDIKGATITSHAGLENTEVL